MSARRRPSPPRSRGFSLIVALLMLAVIGLASAAIMRNATSADQVANGNRLQIQAGQYAQLALRFCEAQLAQAPGARRVRVLPAATPPAWADSGNWRDGPGAAAHALAAADVASPLQPRVAPQCLVEAGALAGTYIVTARGFSADFKADPATGATRTGAAAWLQATLYAEPVGGGAAAADPTRAGPLAVRRRAWQPLLSPPF